MKSYGRAQRSVLDALLDLRVEGERAAERALAGAAAARRGAEEEAARLAADAEAARVALAAARRDGGGPGTGAGGGTRAAEALAQRRYWGRLEARAGAAAEVLAQHRANALARAIDAETAARAAHLRARQRREVVEKAIARRQAAARREAERREEAAMDDLVRDPRRGR
jgi:flagellar biosynthesis chaperone FliJ